MSGPYEQLLESISMLEGPQRPSDLLKDPACAAILNKMIVAPLSSNKVGKRLAAMRGKVQGAYRLDGEFSSSSKTWLYFAMHVAAEAAEQKFQTELTAAEADVGMTLESAKAFHDAMDDGNHAKAVKVLEAAPARLEKKRAAEQREADAKSQAYNDYLADKARAGKAGAEREREWSPHTPSPETLRAMEAKEAPVPWKMGASWRGGKFSGTPESPCWIAPDGRSYDYVWTKPKAPEGSGERALEDYVEHISREWDAERKADLAGFGRSSNIALRPFYGIGIYGDCP